MPFVGEDVHTGHKRRWDADDERSVYALYASDESNDFFVLNQRPELAPRKILPLASKRARISEDDIHIHDSFPSSSSASHRRRRSSQLRVFQVQPASASRFAPKLTSTILSPCHICHRRPTKKSDLDSFAQCQGCGERACFVCIRECQGWNLDAGSVLSEQEVLSRSFHMDDIDDQQSQQQHENHSTRQEPKKGWAAGGHRAVVCSRCCIERGAEGDVACLGCLSRMEGK
ncbi:hypothetical protein B0J13DRAFT_29772 [Dactylonectria estremocensis]|uniref:Uncharacterized protein n=1 Tax=Dactylonectria estremocensis TaxID=1079267 RepID=A0A9P9FIY9_9HYPO|nr:hypothetical protein B0J13DRAFT_29772 [Dactylonectria estremocensis]